MTNPGPPAEFTVKIKPAVGSTAKVHVAASLKVKYTARYPDDAAQVGHTGTYGWLASFPGWCQPRCQCVCESCIVSPSCTGPVSNGCTAAAPMVYAPMVYVRVRVRLYALPTCVIG